jgi:hypothetical protein
MQTNRVIESAEVHDVVHQKQLLDTEQCDQHTLVDL